MHCFLKLSFALLFSILFALSSVGLSASAQELPKFNITDKLQLQRDDGAIEDHTQDAYSHIENNLNPNFADDFRYNKAKLKADMNRALQEGTWLYVQRSGVGDNGKKYKFYSLYFNYSRDCDVKLNYRNNIYYLDSKWTTDRICSFRFATFDANPVANYYGDSNMTTNVQVSFDVSNIKLELFLYSGEYTLGEGLENSGIEIPNNHIIKKDVKFPLRISSYADKDKKSAVVDAALDTDVFKKLNSDVPYPSMYALNLFNVNKEKIPGTVSVLGSSVERWVDVPYGEYRILFVGYYTGDNYNLYNAIPSVVDVRVTEDGFHYMYNPDNDNFCFFKNGISMADLKDNTVDPNTGSWLSPGSAPERCIDEKPWEKDVNSEISAGYNLEEIPQCNTLDLACHISRMISTITGWISSFFRWLFIPDSKIVQTMFSSFLNNLQNSLGFLWTPVTVVNSVYKGIIDNQISGNTCALPTMSMFGNSATIHLCSWRYQLPGLWSYMQLAIQGGLVVGLLWALYRSVMKFFGVYVDDDNDDDISVETHPEVSTHKSEYVNRRNGGLPK